MAEFNSIEWEWPFYLMKINKKTNIPQLTWWWKCFLRKNKETKNILTEVELFQSYVGVASRCSKKKKLDFTAFWKVCGRRPLLVTVAYWKICRKFLFRLFDCIFGNSLIMNSMFGSNAFNCNCKLLLHTMAISLKSVAMDIWHIYHIVLLYYIVSLF